MSAPVTILLSARELLALTRAVHQLLRNIGVGAELLGTQQRYWTARRGLATLEAKALHITVALSRPQTSALLDLLATNEHLEDDLQQSLNSLRQALRRRHREQLEEENEKASHL